MSHLRDRSFLRSLHSLDLLLASTIVAQNRQAEGRTEVARRATARRFGRDLLQGLPGEKKPAATTNPTPGKTAGEPEMPPPIPLAIVSERMREVAAADRRPRHVAETTQNVQKQIWPTWRPSSSRPSSNVPRAKNPGSGQGQQAGSTAAAIPRPPRRATAPTASSRGRKKRSKRPT